MFITIIITVIANPHIHLSLSLDKYLMATNATADVLMLFISYCSRVCINTRSFPLRSFSKWHSCHLQQSPVLPLWWLGGMSLRHLLLAINNWWRCHWYNGRRQVQQSVGECCKAAGTDWLSPRVLGTSTDELICCFPVVSFFLFFTSVGTTVRLVGEDPGSKSHPAYGVLSKHQMFPHLYGCRENAEVFTTSG